MGTNNRTTIFKWSMGKYNYTYGGAELVNPEMSNLV